MLGASELRHVLRDSGACGVVCLEALAPTVAAADDAGQVRFLLTTHEHDFLPDGEPLPAPLRDLTPPRADAEARLLTSIERGRALDPMPPAELDPAAPAMLTYTSGTTGVPKGAISTGANVLASCGLWHDALALDESDVVLALAPLFHITGFVGHMAIALTRGASLVLFHRFDADEAWRTVEARRATVTVAAITAYIAMLASPAREGRDLSSLRVVATGGAPVPAPVVEDFRAATGLDLLNMYGLTESTSLAIGVLPGQVAPVDAASGALSVGKAVGDTALRIVDVKTGEDAPDGAPGELLLRGRQVTPGYWGRPEASAEALADGWLHTGDVAVRDADGWVYIVDRIKDMIVASGYKVWPREVEDVLYAHPAVAEACVVGVPDAYRGETVCAFVVLASGARATPEELRAFAQQRLAAYKYPRRVELVDALPKTATGKVLRRVVRERAAARP
jgi:long-chain acyl-CoA synthetase